jgi:hypothetical protein
MQQLNPARDNLVKRSPLGVFEYQVVPLPGHVHSVPEERCARDFLLARPDEIHALGCGTGGWIEPTRFLVGARTQESSSVRDVMKTEPFGKPAIWMYQFW